MKSLTGIDVNKLSLFEVGQVVYHSRFNYRGVIFEIDPFFLLSEQWYQDVAKSCPPKDEPWYHVLVDGSAQTSYVAQQHLCSITHPEQIEHPLLGRFFKAFIDGRYQLK